MLFRSAHLVDGVTKLKNVSEGVAQGKQLSPGEIQDASLHKLFGFMTADVRVVLIKLFDRLHNIRTIQALPAQKQRQKADETILVYGPLANRLGIWEIANELNARSLAVLNFPAFDKVQTRLAEINQENKRFCEIVSGQIYECLVHVDLGIRNVLAVPENIYTVYQDIMNAGASFDEVDTTPRLAVVVDDWPSCYLALGHLHHLWKPVPGSFDDYIAFPRENLYRSLHTTVLHNTGRQVKLRFRTVEMNKVSDIGVLSRWLYAGTQFWTSDVSQRVEAFLENISDAISIEPHNPTAGVQGVLEDALTRQIRVHTPRGDVIELPMGATPIDFAYAIHTGLGDQCHSAYVNGSLFPLNKPLRDGDTVRIVKKLRAQPQRTWLDRDLGYIATRYAHHHASRWFKRLSEETAVRQGQELLQSELKMIGYPEYPHQKISDAFDFPTTTALYHALGRAELLPTLVATRILVDYWDQAPTRDLDNVVYINQDEKLVVTGVKNRRLRLCGTCNPRFRDPIIGYICADQSVTVHRKNCQSLVRERLPGRILKLGWGETTTRQARVITIQVDVYDRPGLLFEIAQLMEEKHVNIAYINTPPAKKGEMYIIISLEIMSPRQLVRILHQIQALTNVFAVRRLYEGTPDDPVVGSSGLYLPE